VLAVFLPGCLGFLMFLFIVMFSFECLAPGKRLSDKIASEMTYASCGMLYDMIR